MLHSGHKECYTKHVQGNVCLRFLIYLQFVVLKSDCPFHYISFPFHLASEVKKWVFVLRQQSCEEALTSDFRNSLFYVKFWKILKLQASFGDETNHISSVICTFLYKLLQ